MLTLDMLYSTYSDRIYNLIDKLPDKNNNVRIVIVHQVGKLQYNDVCNFFSDRDDVVYYQSKIHGVARSRNIAISLATSDVVLFCDDDVTYLSNIYDIVINEYENSYYDLITFAYQKESVSGIGRFSKDTYDHSMRTIFSVGTIEISCLLSAIKLAKASFPEDLGAGERFYLCDEPVFLSNFIKNKCKVKYTPKSIGCHPFFSSGSNLNTYEACRSRFICFRYIFGGYLCYPIYYLFIIKNIKRIKFNCYYNAFLKAIF
ncbi:glycosyltransferase family A protein [Photobacterium phosphoreum]|uniref:glycosyltransferase family A protein n=1 Tax=Photobacterium phosphoreum TaxID=659 RepID=UPI001E4A47BF|nr:glycosyltransferase family A protein [Photobacterium phosphoreum]MCD9508917.1 glycosyltransferase [Photobacterium phosphoreum]